MAQRRRNTLPKAVLDRVLEVDGEQSSLRDFMQVNLYEPSVEHISATEARRVIDLEPGETTTIGIIDIKRIS